MKNLMSKVLSAASLLTVVLLVACGNGNNDCPSGQSMLNGTCQLTQNVNGVYPNGQYPYGTQTGTNTGGCQVGQVYVQNYGCYQANTNNCGQNAAWVNNQCMAGIAVTYQQNNGQYNGQYPGYNQYNQYNNQQQQGGYWYNGFYISTGINYNSGNTSQCGAGYVYTQAYGCMQQGGCPNGMGMGPFGCTH